MGSHVAIRASVDAPAAPRIIARPGVGKVRHLDTNHIWTQEIAATKRARVEKALGSCNPVGLMTEELGHIDVIKLVEFTGANFPNC